MSIIYKAAEESCYLINTLTGNIIKKIMYSGFEKQDEREKLPKSMYRKFSVKKIVYQGFPVFIIRNKNKEKRDKHAILFLAGGGGMSRPMGIHFDTAARLVQKTGATMYFAYYPLAPKYNVRQALTWLEGVYQAMLKSHLPRNIVFAGDSAGANLALSLTYRVDKKPGKVIAISPASGLENGRDRDIRKAMEKIDPILNVAMTDLIAKNWSKDVPLDSTDVNPKYIDYENFPKILMFYGTHEIFYPHAKILVEKIREDGVMLEAIEEPMCHDWALCSFLPEGKKAIRKMVDFILDS